MGDPSFPVIVLSGAGGGRPDLSNFETGQGRRVICEFVSYPGWQRYVEQGFSAETLIDDLTVAIAKRVPRGPIRLIGLSIGGHLGYASALRLQAIGRDIAGFCAIDSFMTVTSAPSVGWRLRAITQGVGLIRKARMREFARFVRSKAWRALLRLGGARLPDLLLRFTSSGRLPGIALLDPILEEELTMRLMIRELAPWLASIDRNPMALMAPTLLLRVRSTACDDAKWRRRCPQMKILEISGQHHSLFEPENVGSLRQAFGNGTHNWL